MHIIIIFSSDAMVLYSIISAQKGRKAGEEGIHIHVDEHDMPSEYNHGFGNNELFGNGLYFIPRHELYKGGLLGRIDEDIPNKIIRNTEKYFAEVEEFPFSCRILPRDLKLEKKKEFETNFRFY